MKNLIKFIIFISSFSINAQVAIGKASITPIPATTTPNPAISLEFYDSNDNSKGIVIPWVSTVADTPVAYNSITGSGYAGMQTPIADGTLILDLSDKKVKYRRNGNWFNLTGDPTLPITLKNSSNVDVTISNFIVDSSKQDDKKENEDAKVVIGSNAENDITVGALVLSDKEKAMILPKVANPHLTIVNPAAGMIVFDTNKKQLAVFNGSIWSFWAP